MKLSADGRRLGAIDETNQLLVWDVQSGAVRLHRRPAARESFTDEDAFAFSPDGNNVVCRSARGYGIEVHGVGVDPVPPPFAVAGLSSVQVERVAFSPDGGRVRVLATTTEGELHVFDLSGRDPPLRFRFTAAQSIRAIHFSPDGKRAFAYTPAGIREWDLTRPAAVRPGGTVLDFNVGSGDPIGAFSPDGSKLALAGEWANAGVGEIRITNLATRTQAVVPSALFGQSLDLRGVSWTADGRWIAVAARGEPAGLRLPALFNPCTCSRTTRSNKGSKGKGSGCC